MEETFAAFINLWRSRNGAHITLTEIEAYTRIHAIHDAEMFTALIQGCDQTVHSTVQDMADKKDRLAKLKEKTKGK